MNSHDLKIWLTVNKMTQKQLADKLGITSNTISTYCTKQPPKWLKFALNDIAISEDKTAVNRINFYCELIDCDDNYGIDWFNSLAKKSNLKGLNFCEYETTKSLFYGNIKGGFLNQLAMNKQG